jgi:hypothetical protein
VTVVLGLLRHGVLDDADDEHYHDAAYARRGDIARDAAATNACTCQGIEDLGADAAPHHAGEGVAERSERQILENSARYIPADRARDQTDDPSIAFP